MVDTLWAVAQNDKIELLEKVKIPDGTKILVTHYLILMNQIFGQIQARYLRIKSREIKRMRYMNNYSKNEEKCI
jgi:hypothetical protein